jgi:antitoxin (DNA-binding transcriptional repressor) of toxin-antitoxin stability system
MEIIMNFIAMKDLKKTRELRDMLLRDNELVLTNDGSPCAVMIPVSPEKTEETLRAIRTALFQNAISSARRKAAVSPPSQDEIEAEIRESRRLRGLNARGR